MGDVLPMISPRAKRVMLRLIRAMTDKQLERLLKAMQQMKEARDGEAD